MQTRKTWLFAAIWTVLVVTAITAAGFRLFETLDPQNMGPWGTLPKSHLVHLLAYAIAAMFCCRIVADYPSRSPMRTAWSLLLASSLVAILRNGYEYWVVLAGPVANMVPVWRHIPLLLSLLLLMAALLVMWRSLAALGFGLRFRLIDVALMGMILCLAIWIWSLRSGLADASSPLAAVRVLQLLSPPLIAGSALLAVVLLRVSEEMDGGSLAVSLRYLVAFLVIRIALLALAVTPGTRISPAWSVVGSAVSSSYTWLFVLGVGHRWNVTASAKDLQQRYQADPETGLAFLYGAKDRWIRGRAIVG